MNDYVGFEGRVIPMEWGDSTYTVLPLPQEVVAALGNTKRVEGEIAEHPINLAITKAPVVETPFLWMGKSLLTKIGISPGDEIDVRLRPVCDDVVELPIDVAVALRSANLISHWEAMTPGKRRGALHQVMIATRPETRTKRIAKLVAEVASQ